MKKKKSVVGDNGYGGGEAPELCAHVQREFDVSLASELFADCSVIVAMHPDQATEAAMDAAGLGHGFYYSLTK